MPRQEQKIEVNQFTAGLITDRTELTSPPNSSIDENNFNLLKEGTRRRRLGFDLESATVLDTGELTPRKYIATFRWESVAKHGDINFEVIQVGSILYFFDPTGSTFISGEKNFTVDLDNFKAPGAKRTDRESVSMASGKGALFVTGENVKPFYVEYDVDNDTISTTEIQMRIRDLTLQDTTDAETEGTTLTAARRYDLLNQGWYKTGVIIGSSTKNVSIKTKSSNPDTTVPGYTGKILDGYFETFGKYPPKTKPWWIGRGTVTVDVHIKVPGIFNDKKYSKEVDAFQKEAFDLYFGGNTVAPLGHFIVNPFYKNRSNIAGVQGLAVESDKTRPNAVAFYGGRAFWGHKNTVYFSQVILDNLAYAGRCYQDADPTAEDTIGLIPSDGGVITIPDMGNVVRLFVVEGALIIFADNGVWALYSPSGEGFSATSFTVDYVTNLFATGYHSIVDVEGFPLYWGEQSIYAITPVDERVRFDVRDLAEGKIQNYYQDNTDDMARRYAKGIYDLTNKRVQWLWKTNSDSLVDRFEYDRMLNYSLLFDAFYPYSLNIHAAGDSSDKNKAICGFIEAATVKRVASDINVVIGSGEIDPSFADVEWLYPFQLSYTGTDDYTDHGPNGLADAVATIPDGDIVDTSLISSGPNFPGIYAYRSISDDFITLPSTCVPDLAGGDWTLEFWMWSNSWTGGSFFSRGIFACNVNSPRHAEIAVGTFSNGASQTIRIGLEETGATGSPITMDSTTIIANNQTHYISLTRSGNTIYLHINGTMEASADVTGWQFDMSAATGVRLLSNGIGSIGFSSGCEGCMQDVRFTSAARYGAGNYTVPTAVAGQSTNGLQNVVDESAVQVVVSEYTTEAAPVGVKYLVLQNSSDTTHGEIGAGNFDQDTFVDWDSTGFSDDYTSYIETNYYYGSDAMTYIQAPWIYAYITRSSTTYPAAEGSGTIADSETGGAWASIT